MFEKGTTAPVITATIVVSLVSGVLLLLTAFGIPVTEAQKDAIENLITIAAPIIVGYIGWKTTAEYVASGNVVRGSANEGTTGEIVRPVGTLADYDPKYDIEE